MLNEVAQGKIFMNTSQVRAALAALRHCEGGEGSMYSGDSCGSESLDEQEARSIMALHRKLNSRPLGGMQEDSGDMDEQGSDGSGRAETISDSAEEVWSEPDAEMSSQDDKVEGDTDDFYEGRPSIRTDYMQESSRRDLAASLPRGIQLMGRRSPRTDEAVGSAAPTSSFREKFFDEFRLASALCSSKVLRDLNSPGELSKWGETHEADEEAVLPEEQCEILPISPSICAQVTRELELYSARAPYVERMTKAEGQIDGLIKKAEVLGSISQHTPTRGLDEEGLKLRALRAQSHYDSDLEEMYNRFTREAHRQYEKMSLQLS